MLTDNKGLVDSNEDDPIAEPSQNEPQHVLKTIDINGKRSVDSSNIGNSRLLQSYAQKARLRELVNQGATIMTPGQLKRLQACVEEITAILHEQTSARKRSTL